MGVYGGATANDLSRCRSATYVRLITPIIHQTARTQDSRARGSLHRAVPLTLKVSNAPQLSKRGSRPIHPPDPARGTKLARCGRGNLIRVHRELVWAQLEGINQPEVIPAGWRLGVGRGLHKTNEQRRGRKEGSG
ncbi:hypothetical protein J6590_023652 [Homalodisca vitripennis]|nr:hypothetical protein J6590_023652 [Homalodisca vitripennis]